MRCQTDMRILRYGKFPVIAGFIKSRRVELVFAGQGRTRDFVASFERSVEIVSVADVAAAGMSLS